MDWGIRVTGSQVVLGHLVDVLKDREPSLVRDGDTFVLRAKEFEALTDAGSVQARAKEIVEALSTLARLRLQSVEPLVVGNVTWVREDGRRDYFLRAEPGSPNHRRPYLDGGQARRWNGSGTQASGRHSCLVD